MEDRLLIVEGVEDQTFFAAVFRKLGMEDMADLHPTTGTIRISDRRRGKGPAIKLFGAALFGTEGTAKRVGLVVDADRQAVNPGEGFAATLSSINAELRRQTFGDLTQASPTSGFFAQSANRPHIKAGAWVMPDNCADGDLEHFAGGVVATGEVARFQYADARAREVGDRKHGGPEFAFKQHHQHKAALGTWLAWSDPPRMSLGTAVSWEWLDINHPQFQHLTTWLKTLYS